MAVNGFIPFESYGNENEFFLKRIANNLEAVVRLRTEHDHEKYIESFEKEFAEYNGSKYTIAVNSGTTALELALKASGIKENDEVILPSYTYISTALAVSNLGAGPVFADIKETTLTIDPGDIENKLTNKTKAVIPVHIHGNPCEMDKITKIARKNNLALIEDCSHAHGAEYDKKKVGNFGIGCFSCHTTKILSGIGKSGLVTTNDKKIFETIKRMLCVNDDPDGILSKRAPCRIDALQAAILKAKLPYLEKIIERKRNIACGYMQNLPGDITYQKEEKKSRHVYRDFVILMKGRDKIRDYLVRNDIQTKIRYSLPVHLAGYYKYLGHKPGSQPVTESISRKALCLPVSFTLSRKNVESICSKLNNMKI